MFREGDIVEIPLPDGRVAVGWILHISTRFKNAAGFIVFGIKSEPRADVRIDPTTGLPKSMRVLGPLYTHVGAMRDYGWRKFSHQRVSESQRLLTRRQVGDNIYIGDECLGSIEECGARDLKPMLAMGMPVVYAEIEKAFGGGTKSTIRDDTAEEERSDG